VGDDRRASSAFQLPDFELDCRDWLVATPEDGSVPEEVAGAPIVAILSTVLLAAASAAAGAAGQPAELADFRPASAVFSVGLIDEPAASVRSGADSPTAELIDFDAIAGTARYVVPAPNSSLALLAEFAGGRAAEPELMWRFHRLMSSFRWAR
jgi:hypothetical protein